MVTNRNCVDCGSVLKITERYGLYENQCLSCIRLAQNKSIASSGIRPNPKRPKGKLVKRSTKLRSLSVAKLTDLVDLNSKSEQQLREIQTELTYRKTKIAKRLATRVQNLIENYSNTTDSARKARSSVERNNIQEKKKIGASRAKKNLKRPPRPTTSRPSNRAKKTIPTNPPEQQSKVGVEMTEAQNTEDVAESEDQFFEKSEFAYQHNKTNMVVLKNLLGELETHTGSRARH